MKLTEAGDLIKIKDRQTPLAEYPPWSDCGGPCSCCWGHRMSFEDYLQLPHLHSCSALILVLELFISFSEMWCPVLSGREWWPGTKGLTIERGNARQSQAWNDVICKYFPGYAYASTALLSPCLNSCLKNDGDGVWGCQRVIKIWHQEANATVHGPLIPESSFCKSEESCMIGKCHSFPSAACGMRIIPMAPSSLTFWPHAVCTFMLFGQMAWKCPKFACVGSFV